MKYGICTSRENIEVLERIGSDYIELGISGLMRLSNEEKKDCIKILEKSVIDCEACNSLFPSEIRLVGPDADLPRIRNYLEDAMKLVADLGCKLVVFGSGNSRKCPENYSYRKAYKELAEVYQITGDIAKKYGITIVIEPLSRKETNLICTLAEGAILMTDVDRENVGLLADYFHVIANGDNLDDIKTIGEFKHIHIATGDLRRYPRKKSGDSFEKLFENLKAIGYDGRISIEGSTDCLEEDGRNALQFLRELEQNNA